MTDAEKISVIKTILSDGGEVPSDAKLLTYLTLSKNEILEWKYHLIGGVPSSVTSVFASDEQTQVFSVIAGYTHAGSEGQTEHAEGGITRRFVHEDMIGYIRSHVKPYVRVGAVT